MNFGCRQTERQEMFSGPPPKKESKTQQWLRSNGLSSDNLRSHRATLSKAHHGGRPSGAFNGACSRTVRYIKLPKRYTKRRMWPQKQLTVTEIYWKKTSDCKSDYVELNVISRETASFFFFKMEKKGQAYFAPMHQPT